MLVCSIRYMPSAGRLELAEALIKDLPGIIVGAFQLGADARLARNEMVIDIAARHPRAYNMPSLEVAVMTGRGQDDRTYRRRDRVQVILREMLYAWLEANPELRAAATLNDVDVDLRFVEMCGVNFAASTGVPGSHWGMPDGH